MNTVQKTYDRMMIRKTQDERDQTLAVKPAVAIFGIKHTLTNCFRERPAWMETEDFNKRLERMTWNLTHEDDWEALDVEVARIIVACGRYIRGRENPILRQIREGERVRISNQKLLEKAKACEPGGTQAFKELTTDGWSLPKYGT